MDLHSVSAHSHTHVFLGADHARNERRTWAVVWLTLITMVVEIVAGTIFGSMALTADGWHMATHAGALGISAWAYGYARQHAQDERYTFGTGKIADLAGFASALVLGIVALGIAWESLQFLLTPQRIAFQEALMVAVLGLLVNLFSAWLLSADPAHAHTHEHDHNGHDHAHSHRHTHAHGDQNLRAAYLHVVADALTSVLAIAALLAGQWLGWVWLDPVAGLIGAVVIARWSLSLLRQTSQILLDVSASPELGQRVRQLLEADEDRVSDLHLWRVGPGRYACIIALVSPQPQEVEFYRQRLRALPELVHVTIETQACCQPHEPVTSTGQ